MADVITVAVPALPEASAITGDELLPVHQNGRLVRVPQRSLRGTRLFSGASIPPTDVMIVAGVILATGDRWRNTSTGDEWKLTALAPAVWMFDGNVKGPAGADGPSGPPGDQGPVAPFDPAFRSWFQGLPTTQPQAAGVPWNNGGVLTVT